MGSKTVQHSVTEKEREGGREGGGARETRQTAGRNSLSDVIKKPSAKFRSFV